MTQKNAVIGFDRSKMVAALQSTKKEASTSAMFLKMSKSGDWVYGSHEEEITNDMELLVNPAGFTHGFVNWSTGTKNAEIVVPIDQPVEQPDTEYADSPRGWESQLGISLKINDTEGSSLVYMVSSVGGKRAISALAQAVAEKLASGEDKIVPVVTLDSESYKHKKFGTIYNPVINIVRWIAMPQAGDKPAAGKTKAVAAPKKRK